MSGFSKIPKLTYGSSKRSAQQTTNIPSRESTPVQCHDDRGKVKSTPVSSSTSVGRSKSLKLPRKQYVRGPLASNSASRLESGRQLRGANGTLKENDSSSSPASSRTSSPGNAMATDHAVFSSSTEVSGTDSDLTKSSSENPFLRRRAQSFGPNLRRAPNNRHLRPPGNRSRGNTPTPRGGTPTTRSVTPSSLPVPSTRRTAGVRRGELGDASGNVTPTGHRHVRSRSSLGSSGNGAAATEEDHTHSQLARKPVRMRRADSNDVIDGGDRGGNGGERVMSRSNRREVHTIGHTRGRRPNSYIINEPAADLNQLAREITSSMDEEGSSLNSPEIKSVARIHPAVTRTTAYLEKVSVASPSHTPSPSSSGYVHGSYSSSSKTSTSSEKLQTAPLGRGTKYNFGAKSTPEPGGRKSSSGSQSRGTLNSRSSTPSSGRSTPVGVGEPRRTPRISPPGGEATPASGGSSRLQGPGKLSSQRRVIRVREARPVGINELEGAVLMDSDEYLKISHEVKALKTAILKLKRELQSGEQQGGGHVTQGGPAHPVGKTPRRPGGQVADGDRINTLAAEKRKVVEENEELKKKMQKVSDKLEKANSDLNNSEEEKRKLGQRLNEMETHRDLLLDKVERLHADKHKLEDRLRSLEKAQLYEESSSGWVEEGGEGGEGKWEATLMLCADSGGKEEKTESDIGENSDPESTVVCVAPPPHS